MGRKLKRYSAKTKRASMSSQLERDAAIDVVTWARTICPDRRARLIVHIPNEGKRSRLGGYLAKRGGLAPGFPDFFVFAPSGAYGGLAVELKRERPAQSTIRPNQREWIHALRDAGYAAVIAYGYHEAVSVITAYLNLEPGKHLPEDFKYI